MANAEVEKIAGPEDANEFGVVGDIGGSITDIATRIDIYTAYVPKATRWQADLLAGDLAAREEARAAVSTLGHDLRTQTLADLEHMRSQTFVDLDGFTNRVILKVAIMIAVMLVLAALLATIVVRFHSTAHDRWPRVQTR